MLLSDTLELVQIGDNLISKIVYIGTLRTIICDPVYKVRIRGCHLSTKKISCLHHISHPNIFQTVYFRLSALCAPLSTNFNVELEPPCSLSFNPKGFVEHLSHPLFCAPFS